MASPLAPVTGADEKFAAHLREFDPFLDDISQAQVIEDAHEIRELMRIASQERNVAFTFPSMPEIFGGKIMTRPGQPGSSTPLVLVDVQAAGLDTTRWAKNIAVTLSFFDGPEFIACRTSFAGSVGPIMAVIGPRVLYRLSPLGRQRRTLSATEGIRASFELPGEGGRACALRELGPGALRGTLDGGPAHQPGLPLRVSLLAPGAPPIVTPGVLSRIRLRDDQTRDTIVHLDPKDAATYAALVRLSAAPTRPNPGGTDRNAPT